MVELNRIACHSVKLEMSYRLVHGLILQPFKIPYPCTTHGSCERISPPLLHNQAWYCYKFYVKPRVHNKIIMVKQKMPGTSQEGNNVKVLAIIWLK